MPSICNPILIKIGSRMAIFFAPQRLFVLFPPLAVLSRLRGFPNIPKEPRQWTFTGVRQDWMSRTGPFLRFFFLQRFGIGNSIVNSARLFPSLFVSMAIFYSQRSALSISNGSPQMFYQNVLRLKLCFCSICQTTKTIRPNFSGAIPPVFLQSGPVVEFLEYCGLLGGILSGRYFPLFALVLKIVVFPPHQNATLRSVAQISSLMSYLTR